MPISNKLSLCQFGCGFVEWIHDDWVNDIWRGNDPVGENEYRDIRLLDSALARPFQSAGGEDAYPTVVEKAAAMFHSLVSNHPFHNGNKRTAVISTDIFLLANGYALGLTNTAVYKLAQQTASYRARRITHDYVLREIAGELSGNVISLPAFYREQLGDKSLGRFYAAGISVRRMARRHPGNRILRYPVETST